MAGVLVCNDLRFLTNHWPRSSFPDRTTMAPRVWVRFASWYDLPTALSLHAARPAELSHVGRVSPNQALRTNFTRPEELRIDLLRPYQVFQLFQAGKRPVFKDLFRHLNPLE